jgi:hypothetical protein
MNRLERLPTHVLVIGHGGVPDHLAGMRVERHQMSVGRGQQNLVVIERDSAPGAIKQVVVIAAFDLRSAPNAG